MNDNFWPLVIILVIMVVFTHHKIIYLKHFQILEFSGCRVFEIRRIQNAFCKLPFGALLRLFHHMHCVHSHLHKSSDKSFFLEGNNLAPGEAMFKHSVQNIHRNAVVVTLKQTSQKGYIKSVRTALYVLCVVSCKVTPNWCFRRQMSARFFFFKVRTN